MPSRNDTLKSFIDAAADRVARVIASVQREAQREREVRDAQFAAKMAELDTRLASVAQLERQVADRLAALKDGEPGSSVSLPEVVDAVKGDLIEFASGLLAALPRPKDGEPGKDADPVAVAALVDEKVRAAVEALPPAEPGKAGTSVTVDDVAPMIDRAVAAAVSAIPPVEAKEVDPGLIERIVQEAVDRIPAAAPGKSVTVDDVAPMLAGLVRDAVAALPPAEAGRDANPTEIAEILHATLGNELAAALDDKLRDAVAAIPPAQPGKSVTVEDCLPAITAAVEKAVSAIPAPKDGEPGKSVTIDDVRPLIVEAARAELAAWERPKDGDPGESVTVEDVAPLINEVVAKAVAEVPRAKDGAPGKLPIVKAWSDKVYYEAEVVTWQGATYQATRDTGREPPHEDWICLARSGADGRSPRVRNTYEADANYSALDIVALNGGSFIARRDNPGPCPGEGWQLLTSQGKPGKPGPPMKGDPGPAGKPVVGMSVDEQGLLTVTNGDGSTVECDLYPLLSKIDR